MKKNNKLFIGLFIGIVLGFITFKVNANVTYNSDGVLYKKGTENITVTNALDELKGYLNYGNATADNITRGKTAIINGKKVTGTGKDNDTNYNTGLEEGSSNVGGKTVLKVINAFYNADKVNKTYSTQGSRGSRTVYLPLTYEENNITYVLSSISLNLTTRAKYWAAIGGGTRDLWACGTATVNAYACDSNGNQLSTLWSQTSSGKIQGDLTISASCNLFNVTIPDGTTQIKVVATGNYDHQDDGYDTLDRTGETSNTTAVYLAMNVK